MTFQSNRLLYALFRVIYVSGVFLSTSVPIRESIALLSWYSRSLYFYS